MSLQKIKLVVIGLAAVAAIDAAVIVAVNAGKRKLEVGGKQVVALTRLGTGGFVVTLNDAVLTADTNGKITQSLTDPSLDITDLRLDECGKVEVLADQFDLSTYDPAKHDVFTRSGNRVVSIVDAGVKAPTFGRVLFIQNHSTHSPDQFAAG